ncbi:MAG: hypothetical protein M1824_006332 [Vezdaea acicularis]|nr:MAG: hypothetical protein M1824_006332 [Vezdaea acicularis]
MGPNNMYYSSSPTVVLPPNQTLQPFGNDGTSPSSSLTEPSMFSQATTPATPPSWAQLKSSSNVPRLSKSRKRSRDEMASPPPEDLPAVPEPEPIYGEGMTLINPRTNLCISAASQTGTWVEEKADATPPPSPPSALPPRPIMESRKSQRLDTSSSAYSNPSSPAAMNSPPKSHPVEPTVDDFTLLLGIGWTRLPTDPDIQAAARGWARYIENHYPLNGTCILLKSKALESYLVGAKEGFYLFHEDLGEGRLVGTTFETVMANLRCAPVAFEGGDSLRAIGTPRCGGAAQKSEDREELAVIEEETGQEFRMDLD